MRSLIRKITKILPAHAIRRLWARKKAQQLHESIQAGKDIPIPSGLVFEPTQRCNLSCIMCCHRQHHTEGTCLEMRTAEACSFLNSLKKQKKFESIGFIGSEPFVRGDLEELLAVAIDGGADVSVQTNSTLLTDKRVSIWAGYGHRIRSFGTSLEGVGEIDDQIRTGKDVFPRARDGIALAVRKGLPVTVSILLLDNNRKNIPDLIKLLRNLMVKSIDISLIVNHTQEDIRESSRLSGIDEKDICITSIPALSYQTNSEQLLDDLKAALSAGIGYGMKVGTSPENFIEHFHDIRDGSIRQKYALTCGALNTVRVNPAGELIHCQHFRKKLGDLKNINLYEAWNSDEFKSFRKKLVGENLFPICVDCYRMKVLET